MTKKQRALAVFTGHKGSATIDAVWHQIPDTLVAQLTGTQLGHVMTLIDCAYNEGKASAGAEMIDSNAVYINSIGRAIEWAEVGAEYESIEMTELADGRKVNVVKPIKTKDGVLTLKFAD